MANKKVSVLLPVPGYWNAKHMKYSEGILTIANVQSNLTQFHYTYYFLTVGIELLLDNSSSGSEIYENLRKINGVISAQKDLLFARKRDINEETDIPDYDISSLLNFAELHLKTELMEDLNRALENVENELKNGFDNIIYQQLTRIDKQSIPYYLMFEKMGIFFSYLIRNSEQGSEIEWLSSFKKDFISKLRNHVGEEFSQFQKAEEVDYVYLYGDDGNIAPPGIPDNLIRLHTERLCIDAAEELGIGVICTCGGMQKYAYHKFCIPEFGLSIQPTAGLPLRKGYSGVFQHVDGMSNSNNDRKMQGKLVLPEKIQDSQRRENIDFLNAVYGEENVFEQGGNITVLLPPCEHSQSVLIKAECLSTFLEGTGSIVIVHHSVAQEGGHSNDKLTNITKPEKAKRILRRNNSCTELTSGEEFLEGSFVIEAIFKPGELILTQGHFDGVEEIEVSLDGQIVKISCNDINKNYIDLMTLDVKQVTYASSFKLF